MFKRVSINFNILPEEKIEYIQISSIEDLDNYISELEMETLCNTRKISHNYKKGSTYNKPNHINQYLNQVAGIYPSIRDYSIRFSVIIYNNICLGMN